MKYASRIGSHGGWAHNEFAADVASGKDTPAQVRELIDRNDRCLQSVTGVPVRSFAAPVGEHPQPMMTRALDQLGIIGYYYTGDTGSAVERPFYNGTLVSSEELGVSDHAARQARIDRRNAPRARFTARCRELDGDDGRLCGRPARDLLVL